MAYTTDYYAVREQKKTLLTAAFTAATWQAAHIYAINTLVKPVTSNGHYYRCTIAGTSHTSAPAWPTAFWGTVADGTVTWREEEPVNVLDCESATLNYPQIIIGDLEIASEEQLAEPNIPGITLRTTLRIRTYQGASAAKSWTNMRKQAFDILKWTQNTIRTYPTLDSYADVVYALSDVGRVPDIFPALYEIELDWIVNMVVD